MNKRWRLCLLFSSLLCFGGRTPSEGNDAGVFHRTVSNQRQQSQPTRHCLQCQPNQMGFGEGAAIRGNWQDYA